MRFQCKYIGYHFLISNKKEDFTAWMPILYYELSLFKTGFMFANLTKIPKIKSLKIQIKSFEYYRLTQFDLLYEFHNKLIPVHCHKITFLRWDGAPFSLLGFQILSIAHVRGSCMCLASSFRNLICS